MGGLKPYPVILIHGLLLTSYAWLVMGPQRSLGYLLAEAGFDVWMMNLRGASVSKMHTTIPECTDEFWDFSWHEMGMYDLPAVIDYILATTKTEKVDVIGFSLGTNLMVVMASTRPEYNGKVNVLHLIAPSIIFTKLMPKLEMVAQVITSDFVRTLVFGNIKEIGVSTMSRLTSTVLCKLPIVYQLCAAFASEVYGLQPEKHSEELLTKYLEHHPDRTSTKTLIHLAQVALSGYLHQFDMGEDNWRVYGQERPPAYNLSAITAKVRIYYSEFDESVDTEGVLKFADSLPSVIGIDVRKHFRHQDYIFPLDEHVEQYHQILRNLRDDR
ncbi:lipase 3-like [Hetaerina americana]|uniref:lipase 3-like n=1 Tax=Hetaerina americana TaxID=62018 RepID=UPI003A7F256B